MKPTRGLSSSWLSHMPRERRTALLSLGVLLVLLVSLVVYQRLAMQAETELQPEQPTTTTDSTPAGEAVVDAAPPEMSSETIGPAIQPPTVPELLRPLGGERKVLQPFALAYSERYGDFRLHPGIAYEAAPGEAVLAAAAGTVTEIHDSPLDGTTVVLDHGNGLTTRYAGLGKVLVGENATVQPGHIIAEVGKPGQEAESRLYFELTLQGEPIDPAPHFDK